MSAKIIIEESILKELYQIQGLNKVKIAKHLGISTTAVTILFKKYGIVSTCASKNNHEYKHWSQYTPLDKSTLEELYTTQGKSIANIATSPILVYLSQENHTKLSPVNLMIPLDS